MDENNPPPLEQQPSITSEAIGEGMGMAAEIGFHSLTNRHFDTALEIVSEAPGVITESVGEAAGEATKSMMESIGDAVGNAVGGFFENILDGL